MRAGRARELRASSRRHAHLRRARQRQRRAQLDDRTLPGSAGAVELRAVGPLIFPRERVCPVGPSENDLARGDGEDQYDDEDDEEQEEQDLGPFASCPLFPRYRTSAHIEARNLCRETDNGVEEKEALRNRVLALAEEGSELMDPTEPFCRNAVSPGLRRPSHQAHPRALLSIVRKALRPVLRKPSADLANRQPPDQLSFRNSLSQ